MLAHVRRFAGAWRAERKYCGIRNVILLVVRLHVELILYRPHLLTMSFLRLYPVGYTFIGLDPLYNRAGKRSINTRDNENELIQIDR